MPKVLDEDQIRRKKELERKRAARKAEKLLQKPKDENQREGKVLKETVVVGPSPLLGLPEESLQRILVYLPTSSLATLCVVCRALDKQLEALRVPYLLPRLDAISDRNQLSQFVDLNFGNTKERIEGVKSPRDFLRYARFVEQAACRYAELAKTGDDNDRLPEFVEGRFVSVSPEHSVYRTSSMNGVSTQGVGNRGQLGHNEREDVRIPRQIIGLCSKIVQVAAGGGLVRVAHTLLLTNTGRVLSFGCGQYGALGHGFSAAKQLPDFLRPTPILALQSVSVTVVSAGELHSACVTSDGDVYTWGDGFCGQLGLGDKRPQQKPEQVTCGGLEDEVVTNISCGARHTLAVTEDGQIFSWGLGYFGALGRSYTPFEYDADTAVGQFGAQIDEEVNDGVEMQPESTGDDERPSSPTVEAAAENRGMDAELAAHIDLIANLTLDDSSNQCMPMLVDSLASLRMVGVSAGHRHSLALADDGRLFSFGTGSGGCLGHGDSLSQKFPTLITSLAEEGVKIRSMSAGVDISMAVATNGDVYGWGLARGGRIGIDNGVGQFVSIPRTVQLKDQDGNRLPAVDVECGYVHSLIVGVDGRVHMCGGVGIEGRADGVQSDGASMEEGFRGLPQPVLNLNVWHPLLAPQKKAAAPKPRWKKYGKYEIKGRSRMNTEE